MSEINWDYSFSSSYPRYLYVPESVSVSYRAFLLFAQRNRIEEKRREMGGNDWREEKWGVGKEEKRRKERRYISSTERKKKAREREK